MKARTRASGNRKKSSQGAVLLASLIVLLTVSLIGATLSSFFLSVITVAEIELYRAQAFYLAEAGISQAIYQLQQSGQLGGQSLQNIATTPLGEGTYEVRHDAPSGLITATGVSHGVRRSVQVKYQPF